MIYMRYQIRCTLGIYLVKTNLSQFVVCIRYFDFTKERYNSGGKEKRGSNFLCRKATKDINKYLEATR